MNHPVLSSLFPVVILMVIGYGAGRRQWVASTSVRDLSNLAFTVLAPALLFRSVATAPAQAMAAATPVVAYFLGAFLIILGFLLLRGFNTATVVLAMAGIYGNAVGIGIPLVALAYGEAGLASLLTLVSMHSLLLLTTMTVLMEFAVVKARRESHQGAPADAPVEALWRTAWTAVKSAIIHPVPLPIIAGMLFAASGWAIPPWADRPLQWLGQSFAPLALLLAGISLAGARVGQHLRGAVALVAIKNLLHPLLVLGIGLTLGAQGLPLLVMVVVAALPIGANAFMFAQRYEVEQERVTASIAVSTLVALATVSLAMGAGAWWVA